MSLSEILKKTFAQQKSRLDQAGQTVVEYILVLVITVAIIIGILYQFNEGFRTYLDTFFGEYIACLLETGDLPSAGGAGPTQSECQAPSFSFESNMNTNDSRSGPNGSSSGNGDSSGSGGSSGSSGSRGRNLRPSRVTQGGGSGNAESSGLGQNSGRPASMKGSTLGKGGSGDSTSADGGGARMGAGRTVRKTRVIYLNDEYLSESEKKKDKDPTLARGKTKEDNGSGQNLRTAKFDLKLRKDSLKAKEDEGFKFSLGTLLKFLLIIAILIVLFIFLGGQALQVKKSWQKSE